METIELEIDENKVTTEWWTHDVKELFCALCPKLGTAECDEIKCGVSNPWCG